MSVNQTKGGGIGGGGLQTGNNFFQDYTTTNVYVLRTFGFSAVQLSLVNDALSDPVQISWDGATQVYEIKGAEYKDIPAHGNTGVYVKATAGGEKVRLTAV